VEEVVLPEIEGLFADWCKSGLQLRFAGTRHLEELLRANTTTGDAEIPEEWWLWRLNFLRLAGMEEDFETVALDYCITYELSPPDWEPPRCGFSSSELDAKEAADEATPLGVSEELLNTMQGDLSSTRQGTPEFADGFAGAGPVTGGAGFGRVELSADLLGDASAAIGKMDRGRSGFSKVVVDCRNLGRVDFLAAGDLLNWTAARKAEGCKVEFRNLNRLVATFFSVIGIDEFAHIVPPTH
jgi:ABC-type transporter Mla MlaB component